MIRQIQHQTQPTGNTCVCTCIAMLTGKPAQEVVDKWHDLYYSHHEPLMDILEEEGLRVECHYSAGSPRILPGKLYMLTVPSLNVEGSLHQVLVDWRDEAVGPVCLDPAKGLPDRKYYTLSEDEWDDVTEARLLTSWVLDFTIKGWK